MYAIRQDFDPNSLSAIENLVAVLEFIRQEPFGIEEYQEGVIPAQALDYINQFKAQNGLNEEDGLSPNVIDALNAAWITKKYTYPEYISELHTWLQALYYGIDQEEVDQMIIGSTTYDAIQQAQENYQIPLTGTVTVALEDALAQRL